MKVMPRRSIRRHATAAVVVLLPVAAAAFALATLAAEAPAAAASTSSKPAPGAEYTATIKATHGHAVHFVSTATENGTTIHVVGDAGATSGMQTITVKRGSVDEHVQVVRVGPTGYVDANDAALRNVVGLTSAQSCKYAGRWMSFPASNTALDALIGGLLNSDIASELQMRGPYSYVPSTTVDGQAVIGIRGTVSSESGQGVRQILYVTSTGAALPVKEVTNPGLPKGSSAIHGTVAFSDWGEKKTVTAPAHAVSLLKVAGGSTSGNSTSGSKG
jgi:DNA-binding NarL/FixJ family response regulator